MNGIESSGESKPVYKLLLIMKRNPVLTVEEFRDYYEAVHAPYCAQFMAHSSRYVRRYTTLVGAPLTEGMTEPEFDCITEIWFEDREARDLVAMGSAKHAKIEGRDVPNDERSKQKRHMLDLPALRIMVVDEYDSPDAKFTMAGAHVSRG